MIIGLSYVSENLLMFCSYQKNIFHLSVNDLEEAFDSKNIENISDKLLGMQNSLKLLVNVSDYEDRKLQLEGLKNRLEAIVSPIIVQAFTSSNAGLFICRSSFFIYQCYNFQNKLYFIQKYLHLLVAYLNC